MQVLIRNKTEDPKTHIDALERPIIIEKKQISGQGKNALNLIKVKT